jgi:AcrR family transcriptional regulator
VATSSKTARQRVPASERRDALIAAAIDEFALTGYHGTPVDRIARRVGVAQPYVFSLFATKRDLFIAAVERGFEIVGEMFTQAATDFDSANAGLECADNEILHAIGSAYVNLLGSDSTVLMLQLQAYAACGDEVIRQHVLGGFTKLSDRIQELSGADTDALHEFLSYGMYLSVQAAMGGIEDLEAFKAERHAALQRRQQADG